MITKAPPEQYSNLEKIGEEIKLLNEYENTIISFDDILGTSNSKNIDQFFISERNINLDIFYLPQSYFDLPKLSRKSNSNKTILFNETLKDIEEFYRDFGG